LLFFTLFIVFYLSRSFISPIQTFIHISDKVAKGDLSTHLNLRTKDEFQELSESFNDMLYGLRKREKLSRFVSSDVLDAVKGRLEPGGEMAEVCVVFCTLKGFKEASKTNSPKENFRILSCFIDLVSERASRYGGSVDKIIEDTIMLVFRKNDDSRNFIINACTAALAISNALPAKEICFKTGIGLSTGMAVSGKIGSKSGKLDFTVIGNPVNLAARLKAQTHRTDTTGILICPNSIRRLKGKGRLKYIERIPIKGRTRTFPLYELIEMRDK
jgi:adenylate cyclase